MLILVQLTSRYIVLKFKRAPVICRFLFVEAFTVSNKNHFKMLTFLFQEKTALKTSLKCCLPTRQVFVDNGQLGFS